MITLINIIQNLSADHQIKEKSRLIKKEQNRNKKIKRQKTLHTKLKKHLEDQVDVIKIVESKTASFQKNHKKSKKHLEDQVEALKIVESKSISFHKKPKKLKKLLKGQVDATKIVESKSSSFQKKPKKLKKQLKNQVEAMKVLEGTLSSFKKKRKTLKKNFEDQVDAAKVFESKSALFKQNLMLKETKSCFVKIDQLDIKKQTKKIRFNLESQELVKDQTDEVEVDKSNVSLLQANLKSQEAKLLLSQNSKNLIINLIILHLIITNHVYLNRSKKEFEEESTSQATN